MQGYKTLQGGFTLDIEVYNDTSPGAWAQAHFLVHGIDDVLWTDDIDTVLNYLREDLVRLQANDYHV